MFTTSESIPGCQGWDWILHGSASIAGKLFHGLKATWQGITWGTLHRTEGSRTMMIPGFMEPAPCATPVQSIQWKLYLCLISRLAFVLSAQFKCQMVMSVLLAMFQSMNSWPHHPYSCCMSPQCDISQLLGNGVERTAYNTRFKLRFTIT